MLIQEHQLGELVLPSDMLGAPEGGFRSDRCFLLQLSRSLELSKTCAAHKFNELFNFFPV